MQGPWMNSWCNLSNSGAVLTWHAVPSGRHALAGQRGVPLLERLFHPDAQGTHARCRLCHRLPLRHRILLHQHPRQHGKGTRQFFWRGITSAKSCCISAHVCLCMRQKWQKMACASLWCGYVHVAPRSTHETKQYWHVGGTCIWGREQGKVHAKHPCACSILHDKPGES